MRCQYNAVNFPQNRHPKARPWVRDCVCCEFKDSFFVTVITAVYVLGHSTVYTLVLKVRTIYYTQDQWKLARSCNKFVYYACQTREIY